jgi:hypothetical protein
MIFVAASACIAQMKLPHKYFNDGHIYKHYFEKFCMSGILNIYICSAYS